uniref:Putative tick serine proteinase n=1 Tax=Ixodes scapularis TaxID=6945 RepID=A0A4D5RFG3_IXOSC
MLKMFFVYVLTTALQVLRATAQYDGSCGKTEIKPILSNTDRIVGGQEAVAGSWPWAASINLNAPILSHFCGDALISDRHVLTAAHCVTTKISSEVRVHLGSHAHNRMDKGEQAIEAEEICATKGYHGQDENDIAIIRLKKPVKMSATVKPVCLPRSGEELPDKTELFAMGWGRTDHAGSKKPVYMKQMSTKSIANKRCLDYFNKTADPRILCTSTDVASTSHGDSGGPVVGLGNGTTWTLYGIVSDGPHLGGFEHLPLINTKVSHFINDFISTYLNSQGKSEKKKICDLA